MTAYTWIPVVLVVFIIIATIGLGAYTTRLARTASDFYVAGRSVSVFWNASAISGEYLSAASFMGIAGMLMKDGYDVIWYPVCYATGYLFLLLFIAGPLRRFAFGNLASIISSCSCKSCSHSNKPKTFSVICY